VAKGARIDAAIAPVTAHSIPFLSQRSPIASRATYGWFQETPQLSDSGLRLSVAASAYSSRSRSRFTTLLADRGPRRTVDSR